MQKNLKFIVTVLAITAIAMFGTVQVVWQFDKEWTTLERDGDTIAKSKWVVEAERTYINKNSLYRISHMCPRIISEGGYETPTRCYYAPDTYELLSRSLLETEIDDRGNLIIKLVPFYAYGSRGAYAGYINEHTLFEDTEQIEEFPDRYTISWKPYDTRNYKLIWRLEKLDTDFFTYSDFPEDEGRYNQAKLPVCEYVFGNVKIDLKDECSKLESAKFEKGKATFTFKPQRDNQILDISFVDPELIEEEIIVVEKPKGLSLTIPESWRITDINDTELFYDIEDISYDGSTFKWKMKAHESVKSIEKDAKDLPDGEITLVKEKVNETNITETVKDLKELKDKYKIKLKDYKKDKVKDLKEIDFFKDYNRTTGLANYTITIMADYEQLEDVIVCTEEHICDVEKRMVSYKRKEVVFKLGDASIYVTATLDTDLKIVQTGLANDTDYVASIDVSEGKLFMSQTNSSYDVTSGLVLHMSYNNNGTYDYSGNNNHGTGNPTTFGQDKWVTGQVNNALSFDGTNDYVTLTSQSILNTTTGFGITFWGKSSSSLGGVIGDDVSLYRAYIQQTGTGLFIMELDEDGNQQQTDYTISMDDTWMHFAFVFDNNILSFYLNGVLNDTESFGAGTFTVDSIGNVRANEPIDGDLDQIKVYNRTLSATEVLHDYQRGFAGLETNVSSTGLVLWTKLDETDTDDVAVDSSSSNNNGVLYGYPPETTTGNLSYGMDFDGVEDYVSATSTGMSVDNGTIALWFNCAGNGDSTSNHIFSHKTGTDANRVYIARDEGTGYLNMAFGDSYNLLTYYEAQIDNWYHVVLTWNGADYKTYINGVVNLTGTTSILTGINTNIRIGDYIQGNYNFNGTIDDVRIYSRALSADEIEALYNITVSKYETKISELSASAITYDIVSNENTSVVIEVPEVEYKLSFTPTYIAINYSTITFNTTDSSWFGQETITVTENYLSEPNLTRIRINNSYAMGLYDIMNFNLSSYLSFSPNDIISIWYDSYTGNSDDSTLKDTTDYSQWVDTCESGNTSGLVACWNFNEGAGTTANDRGNNSANNNDGTLTNMNEGIDNGTSGWTIGGKFGKALDFDGSNDYVTIGTGSDYSDLCVNGCTFEVWATKKNINTDGELIGRFDSTDNNYFFNLNIQDTADTRFHIGYDGTAGNLCSIDYSADDITADTWYHYVGVFNTTNVLLYRNGVYLTTTVCGNVGINETAWEDSESTFIGTRDDGGFLSIWNGTIDEVKIYNRALSASEISDEYALKKDNFDNLLNQEGAVSAGEDLDLFVTNGTIEGPDDGTIYIYPKSNMTTSLWMIDFGLTGGGVSNYSDSCGTILTLNTDTVDTHKNGSYALSYNAEISSVGSIEKSRFSISKFPRRFDADSFRIFFQIASNLTEDTVTQINLNVSEIAERTGITTSDIDTNTYSLYRIARGGGIYNDTSICYAQPIEVGT